MFVDILNYVAVS